MAFGDVGFEQDEGFFNDVDILFAWDEHSFFLFDILFLVWEDNFYIGYLFIEDLILKIWEGCGDYLRPFNWFFSNI